LRHAQRVATNVQQLASLETISNATDVRRMARERRRSSRRAMLCVMC